LASKRYKYEGEELSGGKKKSCPLDYGEETEPNCRTGDNRLVKMIAQLGGHLSVRSTWHRSVAIRPKAVFLRC